MDLASMPGTMNAVHCRIYGWLQTGASIQRFSESTRQASAIWRRVNRFFRSFQA